MSAENALDVIVVTWRRPEALSKCLASLSGEDLVRRILVVDASATAASAPLDDRVVYLHRPELAGRMTAARNFGLQHAVSDVVAFLDDDVTVRSGWSRQVLAAFIESSVVAVAGRTVDVGLHPAPEPVGTITSQGRLVGNFSADLPAPITIEHGLGANMAFRRDVLMQIGGFRAIFPGTALREDTDVFLRIRRYGVALFQPTAVVDHHGAPHVVGRRFDRRYMYWARHNHVLLMLGNDEVRGYAVHWFPRELRDAWRFPGSTPRRASRVALALAAMAHGGITALRLRLSGRLGHAGSLHTSKR